RFGSAVTVDHRLGYVARSPGGARHARTAPSGAGARGSIGACPHVRDNTRRSHGGAPRPRAPSHRLGGAAEPTPFRSRVPRAGGRGARIVVRRRVRAGARRAPLSAKGDGGSYFARSRADQARGKAPYQRRSLGDGAAPLARGGGGRAKAAGPLLPAHR